MSVKISHLAIALLSATISIAITPKPIFAQPPQQIALQQDFVKLYLRLGQKLFGDGNYEGALESFNKAVEIDPNNPDAIFLRGVTYDSLKKFDLAVADFNRAIALDKDFGMAYYMRGLNYSSKKDYTKAIADLENAERLLKAAGNDTYAQQSTQTLKMLKVLNK